MLSFLTARAACVVVSNDKANIALDLRCELVLVSFTRPRLKLSTMRDSTSVCRFASSRSGLTPSRPLVRRHRRSLRGFYAFIAFHPPT